MKNLGTIVAKLIAVGFLVGSLSRHRYDFYTLLRWIVCAVSAFAAFRAVETHRTGWAGVLAVVAFVFNPIIPVHLKRETWILVDLAAAAILLISILVIDRRPKAEKQ